jgi:heavy metal translocating P-type ATPase
VTADCTHCGLPLPPRLRQRSAGSAQRAFCCSGCYVAHELSLRDPDGRTDRLLARVVLSAFLAMGVMVFSLSLYGQHLGGGMPEEEAGKALIGLFRLGAMALSAPALLLLGAPLLDAVLAMRRWLSADALVLLAASAAFAVSAWNTFRGGGEVYFDTATMVMVLFGLGRWLDTRARERASAALRAVLPDRERPAVVVEGEREREVPPGELRVGDTVRVRSGELIPVDGEVLSGRSFVDTAALTGEEQPRSVEAGQLVLAGSSVVDGTLLVRATKALGERVRDDVERVLEEALSSRAPAIQLADRLASALLPVALVVAAATAVLRWSAHGPEQALLDALSVILISCPCALGIATPLAYWAAMGNAWRRGVLIRGSDVLERIARVHTVLFDKTGTLTSGDVELVGRHVEDGVTEHDVLWTAASLELGSEHPIARSLRQAARDDAQLAPLREPEGFRTLPGVGVEGRLDGVHWTLRRAREAGDDERTVVELLRDGSRVARLAFEARPRLEAAATVEALRARRCDVRMLTGDGRGPARALGRALSIEVEAELDPVAKVARVRKPLGGALFVGDGLNDAAALAAAQVGVSVAGGAARSLDAADVNLLRDGIGELPGLIDGARAAVRAARVNLAWAAGYNVIGIGLAASGALTPIFAAVAMVLSSAAVVLNSSRLVRRASESDPAGHYGEGRSERADSCPLPA